MTPETLKQLYYKSSQVDDICKWLRNPFGKGLQLTGLAGSAPAMIIDAVADHITGYHLIILPGREEAAYIYNDLQAIHGEKKVHFFPASYRKPYAPETVDNANVLYRADLLSRMSRNMPHAVIVTYPAALKEKVVTKKHLSSNTFTLHVKERIDLAFLITFLQDYHFNLVDFVTRPGEYSIRGGIVDVFSFSHDDPFRIELNDDSVDSIRTFDIVSQLSISNYDKISVVPDINDKLLEESRESFLDFIPHDTIIWVHGMSYISQQIQKLYADAEVAFNTQAGSLIRQLSPDELFMSGDLFLEKMNLFRWIETGNSKDEKLQKVAFNFTPQTSFNKNFDLFIQQLHTNVANGITNLLFADTPKQLERLVSILEDTKASGGSEFKSGEVTPVFFSIHEGFVDEQLKVACYTDHQVFNRYHRFKLKDRFYEKNEAITLRELQSLVPGDFITHIDHGVGKFAGLEKIEVNGKLQEAIRLVYRDNDILYVNIQSLHRIARYTSQEGTIPKLNKLGTQTWNTLKQKTKNKVKEIAYDLISLYAKRKSEKGFSFHPDTYLQTELEASFIYEDTPDQVKATAAVKKDMEAPYPMDRLICGDVGFGKTEIAIRAAFKAVADSKQVAILVPTTILALQHYKTFSERLKDFPCKVDYINRFKHAKEQKDTLQAVKEGRVDILIGTHRLVNKDLVFKDLGLLIIDEEQKFGVAVKDKLKTFKNHIDTLTLSATPIPRTLQFSMMGARDLSVITTPPPNRYPVQTELHVFNEEVIRDAVAYEVARGGQVFFVHNRVQNIQEIAGMIQRLCPDARVLVGHGQMDGDKLEKAMVDFIEGNYDVLVATTIIESGLDISNANTIIINGAHMFGLSDLHQMRGRVGRSNKKAFCYLLSPPHSTLTNEARKRLQASEEFSGLGSGFNIAMRDLDIRGAGNLLGAEQSGFIAEIGFETYMKILNEAVEELKESEFKNVYETRDDARRMMKNAGVSGSTFVKDCQVDTDLEILFPDDYISHIAERLSLYKELDELENEEQLKIFETNLRDRFGPLPGAASELLNTVRLRWTAIEIGFEKVVLKNGKMNGYFISKQDSPFYESEAFTFVLDYIKQHPGQARLKEIPGKKLSMVFERVADMQKALEVLNDMLERKAGARQV